MNRELDTLDVTQELSTTWSDYDGNDIYGDFEIDGFGDVVEFRSFEPGIGTVAPWIDGGVSNTTYYHTGLLGSTRGTSAPDGTGALTASYSAFGIMGSTQPLRYGFAGAWGYQTHDDLPYLHVGTRYYDPTTGRFLQRDPIGIVGGLCVCSEPTD